MLGVSRWRSRQPPPESPAMPSPRCPSGDTAGRDTVRRANNIVEIFGVVKRALSNSEIKRRESRRYRAVLLLSPLYYPVLSSSFSRMRRNWHLASQNPQSQNRNFPFDVLLSHTDGCTKGSHEFKLVLATGSSHVCSV